MQPHAVLQSNLKSLRRRSPGLAEALERVEPGDVVTGEGPRGLPTLTQDGMLLASAYAPDAEGRRLAEEMNENDPDLMVAVGFGLGHHLEAFRSLNKCPLVIFEPSRARLRAALSVRPGFELLSNRDVFVVEDLSDLQMLVSQLYTSGLRIGVFPLPALLRLCPEIVRQALDRIRQAKEAADVAVQTRVEMLAQWAWMTAGNAARLRATPSLSRLYGAFRGATAVIACAGPSLTKQLPQLAKVRDRVLLVSIGQAVGALRAAGLEPDLVHVLESLPVVHQLEKGGSPATLNLVVTPDVDPSLFECPAASRFVATPNSNKLACWLQERLGDDRFLMGGGSVAHGAVSIAAALGARRIVLLGQDLAFTNGEVYASGTAYGDTGFEPCEGGRFRWKNVEAKHAQFASLNRELNRREFEILWVDGWDGEKVATSRSYASFIDQYLGMTLELERMGIELINCTEGGARIPRMRHERFAALEAELGQPFEAGPIIADALGDWAVPAADVFDEPIRAARSTLERLEDAAQHGAEQTERALAAHAKQLSSGRSIRLLKQSKKSQRAIRKLLEELPWLDDIVQPELQAAEQELRRAYGEVSSAEEILETVLRQIRAVLVGAARARQLLDHLCTTLDGKG